MITTNATLKILDLAASNDGRLPSYAWPGGYPLFYLDADNNVLCPSCADDNDDFDPLLVAYDVNWEDDCMFCDHCSNQIESAYGDD